MSQTDTLPVAYVGPQLGGVEIDGTGLHVRPAGSPPITWVDTDDVEHEVPTEVEVPAGLARRLVAQDVWEPVGWEIDGTHPSHRGGGVYELSNGETVRGKDDAIAAQAAIDQSDAGGIDTDTAGEAGTSDQE